MPEDLFLDIDRSSAIPLYFQIATRLEQAILDGRLPPGTRLENEIALGHPQGGRAADFGGGDGSLIDMVREYVTPKTIMETTGGDSSTGEFMAPPAGAQGAVFTPIPPPRMPPKDEQ